MNDIILGSFKSKTQYAALAVVILGVLQDQAGLLTTIVGEQRIGLVMAVIGLAFMVLRALTGWSLAEKAQGLDKQGGFARISFLSLLAACSLVLAAGCTTLAPIGQPLPRAASTEAAPVAAARVAIDEANAALIGLNVVIGDNVAAGVWTAQQAQAYLDESRDAGRKVDRARELLKAGLPLDAQSQAEAVRTVILAIHRQVAAAARKEK